jgi:multiple sugar transport system permease protein/putative aldouronate transport system permease protein
LCIYPFYYLIINSVSDNNLAALGRIRFLPSGLHLSNYSDVFAVSGLPHAALVSVGRTVIGTVCTVLASAYLGFMFTQARLWKRQLWYRLVVFTMYFSAGLIPMYMTMRTLHLTNNFLVYIIPAIVQPFNIILVKTYIESLPSSLQEAAEVDGASVFSIFWRIILPNTTPILATIAIFSAVAQWNSFQDALIYVTRQDLYPLQYTLYLYLSQATSLQHIIQGLGMNSVASLALKQTPTSIRETVSVIVVLPIIFIYPIFQRFFVKGIMLGAVKG